MLHKRSRYTTGEIPTIVDLNRMGGEFLETTLTAMIHAMSSTDSDSVLFWDEEPTIVDTSSAYELTIAKQWFCVLGAVAAIESIVQTLAYDDTQYGVYFVASRADTAESRDVLSGGAITPAIITTYDTVSGSVIVTSSGDHGVPPSPPAMGANDIGYVLFATVISQTPVAPVVVHNVSAVWKFPGKITPSTPHGSEHLSTGTDPIPVVTSTVSGLMSPSMKMYLDSGIRGMGSTPPITAALSSNRKATIGLVHDPSLKIAAGKLAINFPASSSKMGTSVSPSRSDHKHYQNELPYIIYETSINVTDADLGSALSFEYTGESVGMVPAGVFWAPSTTSKIRIPCDVMIGPNGVIGVSLVITGYKNFSAVAGNYGFVKFPSNDAAALAILGDLSSVTKTDDGTVFRSGTLFVRVMVANYF